MVDIRLLALNALADLLIDLSAGWFGVVFVVPIASKRPGKVKLFVLTTNLIFGILALIISIVLRYLVEQ